MLLVSSVVVQFDPYVKTGNRLCQFAFGKILSLEKDVPLKSPPIPGFTKTFNYDQDVPVSQQQIKTIDYGAHYVNYKELLETKNTIIVNSFLQKHTYYSKYINLLKDLFDVKERLNLNIDKDELVIHIRGTDYCDGNVHINDEIYLDILDKISPSKASLVTDNIFAPIVEKLCNKNIQLITKNNSTNKGNGLNEHEMYDFVYMLNCNKLLISQSTFSWWPALLGNQNDVYVPFIKTKNCMWKLNPKQDDIDLVPLDSKFKKIVYT